MADRVEIPPALRGEPQQQISQISSYLFRLAEGLNVAFDGMQSSGTPSSGTAIMSMSQYTELRDMIGTVAKDMTKGIENALKKAEESGEFDGNGIASVQFNEDATITFFFTDGTEFTTPVIKGEPGEDYVLTEEDKEEIAGMVPATGITEKYAVGDIFITTREGDPGVLLGYGTWSQIKDSFLLAAGDTYKAGAAGGEAEHTLTVDEMPGHSHGIQLTSKAVPSGTTYARISSTGEFGEGLISETGGSQPHNNMPPYLAVYMWIRTS